MIDPIIGPQQNCPGSETQPSREEQEHEDEHQEAHDSAWPIAPPPTVGPSWHRRKQEHDHMTRRIVPSVTSPILHVLMTSVILATLWRSTEGLGIALRVPFTSASRADLLLG